MTADAETTLSRLALLLAAAMAIGYCVLAAAKTWPLMDGDGVAYFPPVVEWSLNRPLTNPVWLPPLDDSIDGPGGRRYIYHGFLYSLAVGGLARRLGGGPQAAVAAAYVLHGLVALAGALVVLFWAEVRGPARVLLAGLLPVAWLELSVTWHGRVEPLAILLTAVGCWGWGALRTPWREGVVSLAAMLLFFTSPACGFLGGCCAAAAIVHSHDASLVWPRLFAIAAGAVLSVAVVIFVYPFPILDWVGGVIRHGRIHLGLPVGRGFVATWLASPQLPLLVVSFALLAVAAAMRVIDARPRDSKTQTVAFAALAATFGLGVARLAFLKSEASYNAVAWMPLLASIAASSRTRWQSWAVVIAFVFPVIGFVRSTAVLASQLQPHAVSFRDAQEAIRGLTPSGCSVSSGLWMAASGSAAVTAGGMPSTPARYYVRQQANFGLSSPPELPGYRLVENRFGGGVRLFGLPLARTAGGWNFAVYERAR